MFIHHCKGAGTKRNKLLVTFILSTVLLFILLRASWKNSSYSYPIEGSPSKVSKDATVSTDESFVAAPNAFLPLLAPVADPDLSNSSTIISEYQPGVFSIRINSTLTHNSLCVRWSCRNFDRPKSSNSTSNPITVVTAYFNLGNYTKWFGLCTPQLYLSWIAVYSKMTNDLMFYTDDAEFVDKLLDMRAMTEQRTCACLLRRESLWSFRLIPRIKRIVKKPGHPQKSPNTEMPEYTTAMHAKYELMGVATAENVFDTAYFAWSDVGVFRAISDSAKVAKMRPFALVFPPEFDARLVAYSQNNKNPDFNGNLGDIFWQTQVWVCGCFFLAERGVMQRWTAEYLRFVDLLLRMGLTSTDEQVLYAMFNRQFAFSDDRPHTRVQGYPSRAQGHTYGAFFLANLCRLKGIVSNTTSTRYPQVPTFVEVAAESMDPDPYTVKQFANFKAREEFSKPLYFEY